MNKIWSRALLVATCLVFAGIGGTAQADEGKPRFCTGSIGYGGEDFSCWDEDLLADVQAQCDAMAAEFGGTGSLGTITQVDWDQCSVGCSFDCTQQQG